jgi:HEAT repeat protein
VNGLIKALRYRKDEGVRQAAAEVLGKIGDPRAVEPLIAALKDAEWRVRAAAAYALGKIKDPRAVEPLIAALKNESRAAAAYALGEIKDPRAVEPLIAALKDKDVRASAAEALGKIGDPRAVEPLIDALQDKEWFVRRTAAEALISIYRRGGLEDKTKTKILALRDKIAAMHTDEHTDKADCDNHTDIRVSGIEFLL